MPDAVHPDGAALVAALDAALPADGGAASPEARARGVSAAVALGALLARHRVGWDEVVVAPARLARFCGPLGSDFAAEREAAYGHAVRLLLRAGLSWTAALRLPPSVHAAASVRPLLRPLPFNAASPVPLRTARSAPPAPHVPLAPDGDWPTTLRGMIDRCAWHSLEERRFLEVLLDAVEAGQPPSVRDARTMRDLWWSAEISRSHPCPPTDGPAPAGPGPDPAQEATP